MLEIDGMKTVISLHNRQAGFSLAEVVVAMGIGAVAIGGTLLLDSHQIGLVKSTRETNAASMALEERIEQLRIANWRQITDRNYLVNTYYATVPQSAAPLGRWTERITVSQWGTDNATSAPLIVEKARGSTPVVVSDGAGLSSQRLAKMDVTITWNGSKGRVRTRELTTVISNGGISRMNLPAMGAAAGAAAATADSGATDSGAGASTSATPAPTATPTPAATPTPTGNNGNGQGRGNVGGQSGIN